MMKLPTKFSVSREIAVRCGVYEGRYVTADGRSLVDSHDLKSLRMEPEEYVTGIDARIITDEEFRVLRDEGGKRLGMDVMAAEGGAAVVEQPTEQAAAEQAAGSPGEGEGQPRSDEDGGGETEDEATAQEEGKEGES